MEVELFAFCSVPQEPVPGPPAKSETSSRGNETLKEYDEASKDMQLTSKRELGNICGS